MATLHIRELQVVIRRTPVADIGTVLSEAATPGTVGGLELLVCVSTYGVVALRCLHERAGPSAPPIERLREAFELPDVRIRSGMPDVMDAVNLGAGIVFAAILTRPSRVESLRLWLARNDVTVMDHRMRASLCATRHR